MKPMNRHLKIALATHHPTDSEVGDVLMPEGYKAVQAWQAAVITEISADCKLFAPSDVGSLVVFSSPMLLSVDALGEQYHFVQENYIICQSPNSF